LGCSVVLTTSPKLGSSQHQNSFVKDHVSQHEHAFGWLPSKYCTRVGLCTCLCKAKCVKRNKKEKKLVVYISEMAKATSFKFGMYVYFTTTQLVSVS